MKSRFLVQASSADTAGAMASTFARGVSRPSLQPPVDPSPIMLLRIAILHLAKAGFNGFCRTLDSFGRTGQRPPVPAVKREISRQPDADMAGSDLTTMPKPPNRSVVANSCQLVGEAYWSNFHRAAMNRQTHDRFGHVDHGRWHRYAMPSNDGSHVRETPRLGQPRPSRACFAGRLRVRLGRALCQGW